MEGAENSHPPAPREFTAPPTRPAATDGLFADRPGIPDAAGWGRNQAGLPTQGDEAPNECAAIGLSLEDRLDLVQEFGPDLDLDMGEVALHDLQGKLERLAVAVIHHLAEQRVAERLGELEDLMDEHGLEFENITESNNYGYFVHRAERYPAEGCTVMEYRGVEDPDQAVDVWEVRLDDCWNLYFEVQPEGE